MGLSRQSWIDDGTGRRFFYGLVTTVGDRAWSRTLGTAIQSEEMAEIERLRHATFLAVIRSVNPFVMSCVEVVADHGIVISREELYATRYRQHSGAPGRWNWRSIDPLLMDQEFSLCQTKLRRRRNHIVRCRGAKSGPQITSGLKNGGLHKAED